MNQTWDSLCLTSFFFLSSNLPKKIQFFFSVSGSCFWKFIYIYIHTYNIIWLCSSILPFFSSDNILSYFSALSFSLPQSIASLPLVFCCFFCSVSLLDFFLIEQLNLKDYRDILFSIIFYFTRACYYWNQLQASHTLPGELEWIRNICYLPNGGSLCVQSWSVYIRIKCRLQFESEPYALPKLWIFIVK